MAVYLNSTTTLPESGEQSPIPWFSHGLETFSGFFLSVLTVFGIIENVCVFGMIHKFRKEFGSRTAYLLMSLAVSDGLMALIGGTMFAVSSFMHRWQFAYEGCVFYGVVMFATGCVDITHLMVVALDRMLAITSPIKYMAWSRKTSHTALTLVFCWTYGSIWALLPLFGFQRYTYEGTTSCSIDWMSKRPVDVAYNVLIFIASFILPLIIMVVAYIRIFLTVRASGRRLAGEDNATIKKKREVEYKLAINLLFVVVVYMLAWTPYAIVSMWGAFGNASVIPGAAQGLPAVIAKCSMILNPLVYVASNKSHRKRMKVFLGIKENAVRPAPVNNTDTSATQQTSNQKTYPGRSGSTSSSAFPKSYPSKSAIQCAIVVTPIPELPSAESHVAKKSPNNKTMCYTDGLVVMDLETGTTQYSSTE